MGVSAAFAPGAAFARMTDDPSVFVEDVLHKALIEACAPPAPSRPAWPVCPVGAEPRAGTNRRRPGAGQSGLFVRRGQGAVVTREVLGGVCRGTTNKQTNKFWAPVDSKVT
jgi:hypothetical protein